MSRPDSSSTWWFCKRESMLLSPFWIRAGRNLSRWIPSTAPMARNPYPQLPTFPVTFNSRSLPGRQLRGATRCSWRTCVHRRKQTAHAWRRNGSTWREQTSTPGGMHHPLPRLLESGSRASICGSRWMTSTARPFLSTAWLLLWMGRRSTRKLWTISTRPSCSCTQWVTATERRRR